MTGDRAISWQGALPTETFNRKRGAPLACLPTFATSRPLRLVWLVDTGANVGASSLSSTNDDTGIRRAQQVGQISVNFGDPKAKKMLRQNRSIRRKFCRGAQSKETWPGEEAERAMPNDGISRGANTLGTSARTFTVTERSGLPATPTETCRRSPRAFSSD